jgi:flavodoxin
MAIYATAIHAQKPIELYDLIKNLLPDSSQADNDVSWKALSAKTTLSWGKLNYNNVEKFYFEIANCHVSINGKTFACGGSANCSWSVTLYGNSGGYTHVSISPDLSNEPPYQTTLAYLFGKHNSKYTALKKCDNSFNEVFYEVTMPGKKTFWMHCELSGGSGGSTIGIDCYFNKKDLTAEYADCM